MWCFFNLFNSEHHRWTIIWGVFHVICKTCKCLVDFRDVLNTSRRYRHLLHFCIEINLFIWICLIWSHILGIQIEFQTFCYCWTWLWWWNCLIRAFELKFLWLHNKIIYFGIKWLYLLWLAFVFWFIKLKLNFLLHLLLNVFFICFLKFIQFRLEVVYSIFIYLICLFECKLTLFLLLLFRFQFNVEIVNFLQL